MAEVARARLGVKMEKVRIRRMKQIFDDAKLADPVGEVSSELARIGIAKRIKPGMRVAITVGSRGIANLFAMVVRVGEEIRKCGGKPFVLAAMGSHGGGTADGQIELLKGYGFDEKSLGMPVIKSMEVAEIGSLDNGTKVYFDRMALESDGVVAINRVKVHTAFKSDIESGLCKMLAVGLGNRVGATLVHSLGAEGIMECVPAFARLILEKAPVLCGLGILENAYDETLRVKAGAPDEIMDIDRELLRQCKDLLPSLPTDRLDVLLVREIGKDISGTGMDTNIVGGVKAYKLGEYSPPRISKIVVLDLSEHTKGNAMGMGMADLITKRLRDKIDFKTTYTNAATATFLDRARMPMVAENDMEALDMALKTCWRLAGAEARIAIIRNTLELSEMFVSEAVYRELKGRPDIEAADEWQDLKFSSDGQLELEL